jgi:hypothetical protein
MISIRPNIRGRPADIGADGFRKTAAGASSETLNRAPADCGRKHHLGHANRIDHIKQMNLVGGRSRTAAERADLASLGRRLDDPGQMEAATVTGLRPSPSEHDEERRIAQEEEEAAVAEIQRLVVDERDEQRPASRPAEPEPEQQQQQQFDLGPLGHTTKLAKQTKPIPSPSGATTKARAQSGSPASSHGAGGRSSSRQMRMERVCQNQSFYLFENDYPETRSGALDDKCCIKIGGRETVELAKQLAQAAGPPPSAHSRQNLFRESPDFIMITGDTYARLQSVENRPDHHQRQSETAMNETQELDYAQVQSEHNKTLAKLDPTSRGTADRWNDSPPGPPRKCRVLNLGHDFEFVGSKSGHKFFVEKHTMTTPVSEVA